MIKVKKRFIPDNIRKLLRNKLKLSKGRLDSDDWRKNHGIIEKISAVLYEAKAEFKPLQKIQLQTQFS